MNKLYKLVYYLNIFTFLILIVNYLFIFNYNSLSIVAFIPIIIIYIILISNFKKYYKEDKIDYLVLLIYVIYMFSIFISGIILQTKTNDVFILLYNNKLLLIPHILFMLYNVSNKESRRVHGRK